MLAGLHENDAFVLVARRYCRLIDEHDSHDVNDLICQLHRVLPGLLFEASALLKEAPALRSELPAIRPEAEYLELRNSLSAQLGDYDICAGVTYGDESIPATLSDCLGYAYWELKRGLAHLDGSELAFCQSMWDWRVGYESLWGRHLIEAFRTVHSLMFTHRVGE